MIIIGIDPGLTMTGVAVYDTRTQSFIDVYAVGGPTGMKVEGKCEYIRGHVLAYVDQYVHKGAIFAIEENHATHGHSMQSAFKQRELIGVMAERALGLGMEVVRVAPTSAKKALTGSGKADKRDMSMAAMELLDISDLTKKSREAVADAMGIALAAEVHNGQDS
jgi:crossover junction endodeoxyribonuclease RuvC